MENLTGKRLSGQYLLEECIGSGGMSDVYKAWDSSRSIHMAIKVLDEELSRQTNLVKMFEGEAQFLEDLGHPNIARLYEFNIFEQYRYLVLEWIDGESLDKIIKRHASPFTLQQVSEIFSQISSALSYLHIKDVIHCDIKPGNILINKNQKVFLADFGVARYIRGNGTGGTPPYMAPEQFTGKKISLKTDIYALGVTIYELLSGGNLPFLGTSTHSKGSTLRERIAWEHINLPLPPITIYNRSVPDSIVDVLTIALNKNPNHRYPSTREFYNAYEAARSQTEGINHAGLDQIKTTFAPSKDTIKDSITGFLQKQIHDIDWKYRNQKRLIGIEGEWQNRIILIKHQSLTLGRNQQMQVHFSDPSVSRYHSTLFRTNQGVFIQDNGSSLGTFVNGQRLISVRRLRHKDRIQIGHHNILEYRER